MAARNPFYDHTRRFEDNRYVYPVVSRRAGGFSIGVNLHPGKACNFRCVYCQVDRSQTGPTEPIDLERLADELIATADLISSGRIYDDSRFRETPATFRRLNDFALSGDGEPTAHPDFPQVVDVCAEIRRRLGLDDVKLVLITNASVLHHEPVRRALEVLDANHGEIWAKLDAGSETYFRQVARSNVAFGQILDNLREAALRWPLVIQTLLMRIRGELPPLDERTAYCLRLRDILTSGGRIKLVQLHTVARTPAVRWVGPLSSDELEAAAETVRRQTGLDVATYPG